MKTRFKLLYFLCLVFLGNVTLEIITPQNIYAMQSDDPYAEFTDSEDEEEDTTVDSAIATFKHALDQDQNPIIDTSSSKVTLNSSFTTAIKSAFDEGLQPVTKVFSPESPSSSSLDPFLIDAQNEYICQTLNLIWGKIKPAYDKQTKTKARKEIAISTEAFFKTLVDPNGANKDALAASLKTLQQTILLDLAILKAQKAETLKKAAEARQRKLEEQLKKLEEEQTQKIEAQQALASSTRADTRLLALKNKQAQRKIVLYGRTPSR